MGAAAMGPICCTGKSDDVTGQTPLVSPRHRPPSPSSPEVRRKAQPTLASAVDAPPPSGEHCQWLSKYAGCSDNKGARESHNISQPLDKLCQELRMVQADRDRLAEEVKIHLGNEGAGNKNQALSRQLAELKWQMRALQQERDRLVEDGENLKRADAQRADKNQVLNENCEKLSQELRTAQHERNHLAVIVAAQESGSENQALNRQIAELKSQLLTVQLERDGLDELVKATQRSDAGRHDALNQLEIERTTRMTAENELQLRQNHLSTSLNHAEEKLSPNVASWYMNQRKTDIKKTLTEAVDNARHHDRLNSAQSDMSTTTCTVSVCTQRTEPATFCDLSNLQEENVDSDE